MLNKKYYIAAILILAVFNLLLIIEGQRKIKRERILTAQLVEHEKLNSRYIEPLLIENNLHTAIKGNKNKVTLFYFLHKSHDDKAFRNEVFFLNQMTARYPGRMIIYYDNVTTDTLTFLYNNDLEILNWVKRDINLNCSFALLKDKNNILQHTYILNPAYPAEYSKNLISIASILNSVYDN